MSKKEIELIKKFDDVIENEGVWSQICSDHVKEFYVSSSMLDSVGNGICGVEGCNKEADYYIDFI